MVSRGDLPLSDDWDDHAPGTLTWLQAWYATQCNGDWEHGYGVRIETLDNPGWGLRVDLGGTAWAERPLDRVETHRSEHDWVVVWKDETEFHAATGPLNLGEAVHIFRLWLERDPSLPD